MADVEKYARLMGVSADADLSEIKQRYNHWQSRFENQIRSDNPEAAQKGRKNMLLLDEAYQVLAAVASKGRENKQSTSEFNHATSMSVELATHRVGFNLNESDGFTVVVNRRLRHFKINWPYGKVTFYNNKLKLKALMFTAEIQYRHIDRISRLFFLPFTFRIQHQEANVYPMVVLYGFGLGSKIKKLNDEHRLELNIEY